MPKNGKAPKKSWRQRIMKRVGVGLIVIASLLLVLIIAAMYTALKPAPRGTSEPSGTPEQQVTIVDPTPSPSPSKSSAPVIQVVPGSHEVCFKLNIGYSAVSGEVSGVGKPSTKLYIDGLQQGPEQPAGYTDYPRSNTNDRAQIKAYTSGGLVVVGQSSLDNYYVGKLNLCAIIGADNKLYAVKGFALFNGSEPTSLAANLTGPTGDKLLASADKNEVKDGATMQYEFPDAPPLKGDVTISMKDGGEDVASVKLALDALK